MCDQVLVEIYAPHFLSRYYAFISCAGLWWYCTGRRWASCENILCPESLFLRRLLLFQVRFTKLCIRLSRFNLMSDDVYGMWESVTQLYTNNYIKYQEKPPQISQDMQLHTTKTEVHFLLKMQKSQKIWFNTHFNVKKKCEGKLALWPHWPNLKNFNGFIVNFYENDQKLKITFEISWWKHSIFSSISPKTTPVDALCIWTETK